MRNCCISANSVVISFVIVMYIFVIQNIIIEERHFFTFTIFRDNQLVSAHLKGTIICKYYVQNFLIPTANLFIISGSIFFLVCLSLTLWLPQVTDVPRSLGQSCDATIVSFMFRFFPFSWCRVNPLICQKNFKLLYYHCVTWHIYKV